MCSVFHTLGGHAIPPNPHPPSPSRMPPFPLKGEGFYFSFTHVPSGAYDAFERSVFAPLKKQGKGMVGQWSIISIYHHSPQKPQYDGLSKALTGGFTPGLRHKCDSHQKRLTWVKSRCTIMSIFCVQMNAPPLCQFGTRRGIFAFMMTARMFDCYMFVGQLYGKRANVRYCH